MKNIFITVIAAAVVATTGCEAEKTPPVEAAPRDKPQVIPELQPEMPVDHPEVVGLEVLSRGPRRMSVDQIERSIEKIGELPVGSIALDPSLALALGRPDYLRVTEESLEPSPLFMKFMMDLAGYVCTALSDYDPMRPQEQRVLNRFPNREENIRYMLLRFTGVEGAAADEYIPRLSAAWDEGLTGARGEKGGGEAVCMSLFTSPEFLIY